MTAVTLHGGEVVTGTHPLVAIGPNGVGKSRFGTNLARNNGGQRVAALRQIELSGIPMITLKDATAEITNSLQQTLNNYWQQANELHNLMAMIVEEDAAAASSFRKRMKEHKAAPPGAPMPEVPETRLDKVVQCWNRNFPGRKISLDRPPMVTREIDGAAVTYPVAQMSEGERTALYLIARIVSLTGNIIVVDEPETYFHPVLARRLWDDLEQMSAGVRFVYVTHDLSFALSRKNAQFLLVRSSDKADVLPIDEGLPRSIVSEVLGAASFSISATKLVFCEGEESSFDYQLLSAWHKNSDTAVIPVGSCENVIDCVNALRSGAPVTNVEAYGYIDRDYRPDSFFTRHSYVKALPVHEVEGILLLKQVWLGLSAFLHIKDADAEKFYADIFAEEKSHFKDGNLNKQILLRSKFRSELELQEKLNPIKPHASLADTKANYLAPLATVSWDQIFDSEAALITKALIGTPEEFLRILPSKSAGNTAAKKLGVTIDLAFQHLCAALRMSDVECEKNEKAKALRDSAAQSLGQHLWPRDIPNGAKAE